MKTLRKVTMSLLMLAVMAVSAVLPASRAFAAVTTGSINVKDYIVASTLTKTEKVSVKVEDSNGNYEIFVGETGDLKLEKAVSDKTILSGSTIAAGSAGFAILEDSSKSMSLGNKKKAQAYTVKNAITKGKLASYNGSIEILQWEGRKTSYEGLTTAAVNELGTDSAATKKTITYYNAQGNEIGTTINVESPYLNLNLDTALTLPIDLGNGIYCLCMLPLKTNDTSSYLTLSGFDTLTAPKKVGHKLDGWKVATNSDSADIKGSGTINVQVSISPNRKLSISSTQGNKSLLNTIPSKDAIIKLSPNYIPNTYTVKFNYSDGTSKTTKVKYKQKYSAGGWMDKNPTKTGYIFAGWYTDPKGGTAVLKDTICLEDLQDGATINLYPHYNTDKYTMTISYKGKNFTKQYEYDTVVSAAEMLKAVGITSSDKYEIKISSSLPDTVMTNVTINGTSKYTVRRNCSVSISPVYKVTLYGNKTSKTSRPYTLGTDIKNVTPSSLNLGTISNTSLAGMKKEFAGWVNSGGSTVKTINSAQTVYALYNIEGSADVTVTGTISGGKVTEAKINGNKAAIKSCNVSNGRATLVIEYSGKIAGYDAKATLTISNIDVGETKTGFNTSAAITVKGTEDAKGNSKITSASGSRNAAAGSFYYSEASKLTVVYHGNGAYYGVMRDQEVYKNGSNAKLNGNNYSYPGKFFKGWALSAIDAKNGIVKYKNGGAINPKDVSGDTLHLYAVWG